ncbi:hypothetical protein D3C73_1510260 [compost metagenome]
MGTAAAFVAANAVEGQGKVLCPGGEHPPHVTRIAAVQFAERGVAEHHVVGVTGAHGVGIQTLEGLIELGDQGVVVITHGRRPSKMVNWPAR